MSEIFYDSKSGNYFMQPQGYQGGYNPFMGGMGRMGWGIPYRQPAMPLQNFGPSMVAQLTQAAKNIKPNVPTMGQMFNQMGSPFQAPGQPSQYNTESNGAGRFMGGLLGSVK